MARIDEETLNRWRQDTAYRQARRRAWRANRWRIVGFAFALLLPVVLALVGCVARLVMK